MIRSWDGYEVPPTSNANYGWILNIVSKLSQNGVAGFLLANGALSDDGTELKIRRQLIENNLVEAIIILTQKPLLYHGHQRHALDSEQEQKGSCGRRRTGRLSAYRNREREILFMDLRQMGSPYEKKYIELTEEDRAKVTARLSRTGSRKAMKKPIRMCRNFVTALLLRKSQKRALPLCPADILSLSTVMRTSTLIRR